MSREMDRLLIGPSLVERVHDVLLDLVSLCGGSLCEELQFFRSVLLILSNVVKLVAELEDLVCSNT